jgi:hypothetical protein
MEMSDGEATNEKVMTCISTTTTSATTTTILWNI